MDEPIVPPGDGVANEIVDETVDETVEEIVEALRALEERLRDLAYDRLRDAVEAGATKAPPEQKRLEQARRAVARAMVALGGAPPG